MQKFDIYYPVCGSSHATGRIEELLQEDQEVKARRERCQKQAAALSKLTRQLSMQEARTSAASSSFGDSCKFISCIHGFSVMFWYIYYSTCFLDCNMFLCSCKQRIPKEVAWPKPRTGVSPLKKPAQPGLATRAPRAHGHLERLLLPWMGDPRPAIATTVMVMKMGTVAALLYDGHHPLLLAVHPCINTRVGSDSSLTTQLSFFPSFVQIDRLISSKWMLSLFYTHRFESFTSRSAYTIRWDFVSLAFRGNYMQFQPIWLEPTISYLLYCTRVEQWWRVVLSISPIIM